jgi:hypothetical protein
MTADNVLRTGKFHSLALVKLLQSNFIFLLLISASSGTFWTTFSTESGWHTSSHAKHLCQDVVQIYPTSHTGTSSGVKGSHAMGIIEVSFLLIVKNFICLTDSLEFQLGLFSLFLRDLVWVML